MGLFEDPPFIQLCMGPGWGIEATPENLIFMKNLLPPDVIWSALGVGKGQLPMITMAFLMGGHIRVGFEDNIYLRRGVLLKEQCTNGRSRGESLWKNFKARLPRQMMPGRCWGLRIRGN